MNRYQWKYIVTGPKPVLAALTVVVTMALAGGAENLAGQAGPGGIKHEAIPFDE